MAAALPWQTLNLADEQAQSSPAFTSLMRQLATNRRLIIVTGAGISVTAGIPDFRSPGGLYERVSHRYAQEMAKVRRGVKEDGEGEGEKEKASSTKDLVQSRLPVLKGQEFFDAAFLHNPATRPLFFRLMAELRDDCLRAQPTECHRLLAGLIEQGRAARWYTQNIDDLEERCGLLSTERQRALELDAQLEPAVGGKENASKNGNAKNCAGHEGEIKKGASLKQTTLAVQQARRGGSKASSPPVVCLHGTLSRLQCTVCRWSGPWTEAHNVSLHGGEGPACPACQRQAAKRQALGQRPLSAGILRPAIVLYSEAHPQGDLIAELVGQDTMARPSGLLVLGTSLRVPGLKRLVKEVARAVHAQGGPVIQVNLQPLRSVAEWRGVFDYELVGDCDGWSRLMRPLLLQSVKDNVLLSLSENNENASTVVSTIKLEETAKEKPKQTGNRLPFKQQKSATVAAPSSKPRVSTRSMAAKPIG